jgi:hypothetical protein
MATRCKFICRSVEDYGTSKKVILNVVYEGELGVNEENKRFTKATPSGECWLTIDNPAASCQFFPGVEYYATFEVAPLTPGNDWLREARDRAGLA